MNLKISLYNKKEEQIQVFVFALVAQSVERVAVNHKVIGSNPVGSAISFFITCTSDKINQITKKRYK